MDNKNMNDQIKQNYIQWRAKEYQDNVGFFPIFSNFDKYFKQLSPGAITLYLYFGLKANYKNGTSFYSLNRIASDLGKTPRTITNWIQELVDAKLIYRKQNRLNSVSVTYLLPY